MHLLLATAWAAPSVIPPRDGEQDAALVIGIDDYLLLPDVPGADDNASEWVDYLQARGLARDRIVLLRDAEANDARIRARAAEVAGQAGADGRVWLVFIGHGAPSADGQALLVGVDAAQDAETLLARSVPQDELLDTLSSQGRPVVAVFDACFSGRDRAGDSLLPGLQPVLPTYAATSEGPATVVSAAAADQFAGAWPEVDRPALSWLLLHPDAEGELTLADGVADAERRLRTLSDRRQTPSLVGPTDLVLGTSTPGGATGPVPMPSPATVEATVPKRAATERKNTGWKVLGSVLGTGAAVAAIGSLERRNRAATTDAPIVVDYATRAARTNAVLAWGLGGLSAASFTVAVVR